MYTAESKNEYMEVNNLQPSTDAQIFGDPSNNAHEETKENELFKPEESIQQVNRSTHFSCLQGKLNKIITDGVILLMIWIVLLSLSGNSALPGGTIFGLLIISYSAFLGGKLLEFIKIPLMPPLPPLLGMLLAGFVVRNIPFISEHVTIPSTWSSALRNCALTVILIHAGFGMDPQALKHLKGVCLRLSFGPCIIEACSAAVFSHYIMKFPWQWGFLLGFVLGAVSPAVVVPSMLLLQKNGFGIKEGIPTLLNAASSLDDIVAITGFNTFLSIVFASGTVINHILSSLRDICIGIVLGITMGFFVQHFPSGDQERHTLKRAFLVLSICVSVVLGSHHIGLHGSGGLCTLVMSFMAATKWAEEKDSIQNIISHAWSIFQPLLFGLVGSEVAVDSLESNSVGTCIATLILALCARILATFALMSFAGFSFKEKIFIALAWIPKATVQAVLSPLVLETARLSAPHLEFYSRDVMTMAFLAILITAPNGALLIGILGPRMLKHSDTSKITMPMKSFEYH